MNKADLEHGAYYSGNCRNATIARWDNNLQMFVHWRTKFGQTYLECIKHPDDEKNYDVFKDARKIDVPDVEIPLKEEPTAT